MSKKSIGKKKIVIIAIVVVAVAAVVLAVFGGGEKPTTVTVENVSRRTITETVSAIGKIQPETEVKISSEASGEVIFVGAKEGDSVRKGQLLVRIQPDLIETQVDQFRAALASAKVGIEIAKAELERAEADMKRVLSLFQKQFASKQEMETSKAAYERAQGQYQTALTEKSRTEAALKQISVSLSRTSIYAPIGGVLTKLDIEQGEKVVGTAQMQGTEMMRISDLNVMNAIVDVDENDVVKVHVGDTARVKIDAYPNREFLGYVAEVSHSPKQKGIGTQDEVINFEVKIRLVDKEVTLRPGMSCSVEIETETHSNVLSVPLQSITIRSDAKKVAEPSDEMATTSVRETKRRDMRPPQVVFVVDNGKVRMVTIESGLSDSDFIEVKSGLKEGQTVVSGSYNTISKVLRDSMAVVVESAKKK
ncbi:MAG: efflux RND transporter periplasmic adaptor subunit [Candidatus Kapaibacterium sp.]|jgi:HlyD family secretion protein